MASLDDLKKRIMSVKSTQKITKAMKMVAAAKLRKAQENAEKGRPYSQKMQNIILNLTIPQAHYEISKRALEANKHVYCEKPMSVKFDEAKELLNLAKKK